MNQPRTGLAAVLIGLPSAVFLLCLLTVARANQFVHAANHLATSGQASQFVLKDAVNLWQVLFLTCILGCAMALSLYGGRTSLLVSRRNGSSLFERFLPDARPNHLFAVLVVTAVILLSYLPCLNFAFLGEDFLFIIRGTKGIKEIFEPVATWYHYTPIGFIFMGLPARFFGPAESVYHAYVLALHLIACVIVYFFFEYVTRKRGLAFLTALMYSIFSMHYEAVFWGEGQFYQLSTLFSVLSLWLFIVYLRERKLLAYVVFVVIFAVNILTYEQGIAALAICFFYDVLVGGSFPEDVIRKRPLSRYFLMTRKYVIPACFVLAFWLFRRIVIGATGIIAASPTHIARFYVAYLMSFITPGFYFGLAAGQRAAESHLGILTATIGTLLLAWRLFVTNRFHLFLLLWLIVAMFPNALFGTFSSRNFPLPAVAYVALLASLVFWISSKFAGLLAENNQQGQEDKSRKLAGMIVVAITIVILFANFLAVHDRERAWSRVSDLAMKLTRQCVGAAASLMPNQEIHFVGRPAGVETGEFWPPPPIFGPSFREEIALRSGTSLDRIFEHPEPLTESALQKLSGDSNAVVLVYDSGEEKFKHLDTPVAGRM